MWSPATALPGGAREGRDYAAGPLARVRVVVCDWPAGSVQAMLTLSPGWSPLRISAISTPRNAVAPMCTVAEAWPALIWLAIVSAELIGIANPVVSAE